jgi:DNA-directed RNA polymerase specialized sigma24 family protein
MTGREMLYSLLKMDNAINAKFREIESSAQDIYTVKAVQLGERVQTSPTKGAGFEKAVEALVQMQEDAIAKMNEYVETKAKVIDAINDVPDPVHRELLTARFVQGLPLEEIADGMGYVVRHIHRIKDAALDSFDEVWEKKGGTQ